MEKSAGSYDFGHFDENENELSRLKRQAALAQELETQVLRGAGLGTGMKVLDLACGPGIVTRLMASIVGPTGQVTGVDLSTALLAEARSEPTREDSAPLDFQQGDVYALPFEDESFDFVYARLLFQHLAKAQDALSEIRRVLRPGGMLCVMDIDDDWLFIYPEPDSFRAFTKAAGRGQSSAGGDRNVGRKLGTYLSKAEFADVTVQVISVGSAAIGMKNFLDITTGFKLEQVPAEERAAAAQQRSEIYRAAANPHTFGLVGAFVVMGRRAGRQAPSHLTDRSLKL